MSWTCRLVLLVIAVEVGVGGFFAFRRMARPGPPAADWALLDAATADHLRAAVATCETPDDWRDLGELYMAAGCFAESERCHRVACGQAPNDAGFARQWAFALERLALLDEANAQYRRAIELNSSEADACRYFIARNLLRADKPAEARAIFAEGKSLPANRHELARLHLRAGEYAEAAELLQGLLAVSPNALQVHLLGYRLELERGNAQRAFNHADRARFALVKLLNPFDEEAARIVKATQGLVASRQWKEAHELIQAGRFKDADAMLRADKRTPVSDELRADIALHLGRHDDALELLQDLHTQSGPSARIFAKLGDAWDASRHPAKARANWLRAAQLEAGADLKSTHRKLADSFADAGDKTTAFWHRAREHYYIGRDVLKFGYTDKSPKHFEDAVLHDPKMAQAWFYLGEARRLNDQKDLAAVAYRTCLKLDPDHGRALASLAYLEQDKK